MVFTQLVSVAWYSQNIQATSKGSDQTARTGRLIWGFAGRTYHIVGNLMSIMLWELKRTSLMRRFCWAPKTNVKNDG